MNGFGVGVAVALGWGVGMATGMPDPYAERVFFLMVFFGGTAGFIFHLCQMAFRGVRLPFNRRKS